jgi:glycosyltransferase involved in cell wall biosynthesis
MAFKILTETKPNVIQEQTNPAVISSPSTSEKTEIHKDKQNIFVYGFPGLYGGAGTELHHQIIVWVKMGLGVNIIPTNGGYKNEPLYKEMLDIGVRIHNFNDFSVIKQGCPVLGFCNSEFLDNLPQIYEKSKNTVFVNCMTWLFDKEKQRMKEGLIHAFLYQNKEVLDINMPKLRAINSDPSIVFADFNPYFDATKFPFIENRDDTTFNIGRISHQDTDKFAKNTLHIWDYAVAPVMKKGYMLGFGKKSEEKIGKPYDWITTYPDQNSCSQQEFYKKCHVLLQPMDTTENYPRIGFEAMSSGSILIVDNRGGWRKQVKHGVTGWLCNHERDFIYYASKMAYEPEVRKKMAVDAKKWCEELSSLESSTKSWGNVFKELNNV